MYLNIHCSNAVVHSFFPLTYFKMSISYWIAIIQHVPTPWEEYHHAAEHAGATQLESSFAEKDLEVLRDHGPS